MLRIHTLLAAIAAVPLAAQDPAAPASVRSDLAGPRHDVAAQAFGVHADADAVQAMGPHWKARIADGLRFTPAFGDRAEHNQDLDLRLQAVRRGDDPVDLSAVAAKPVVDGNRVEVARGKALRERYDVRADGIELSYVFAERPAGNGDLVVASRVATPLQPRWRDDGTLAFELPGIGGATVGAVTGIDARGARAAGTLRLRDGVLEMVLPAAFVDAASYPLVLDPLIGTQFQVGVNDDGESDAGYERSYAHYLVAWTRRYSAFDHDVYAQFVTPAGVPVGAPIWVDSAVDVCARPRVGTVPLRQRYLVVYQTSITPFGQWDLTCRIVEPGGTVSARTDIAAAAGVNEWNASVCSEITSPNTDTLVAYATDNGVQVVPVTIPATGPAVVGTATTLSASSLADSPSISRSGGVLGLAMVVWSQATASDRELMAAVVNRSGAVLAPAAVPFTNNAQDDDHPVVDGDGSTFVVVYEQAELLNPALRDIMAARLQFTGSSISRLALDVPVENTQGQDEHAPDTAWLGPKHCVVFEEYVGGLNTQIGSWLITDNCQRCNTKVLLNGLNPTTNRNHEHQPRICPRWSTALNGVYDDGLITFTESDDVPPFAGSVVCQLVEALGAGTAPVTLAPGCGNGGSINIGSTGFVLGNQDFQIHASGLQAGAVPFLSLGFAGPGIGCGACSLVDPVVFEFRANNAGSAGATLHLPCDPSFTGIQIEMQWVSFLTSVSPCPVAAGLSASPRAQLTLGN